jgi:hypothetical protein
MGAIESITPEFCLFNANDRSGSTDYEYFDSLNRDTTQTLVEPATGAEPCRKSSRRPSGTRSVALGNIKLSSLLKFFNPTSKE